MKQNNPMHLPASADQENPDTMPCMTIPEIQVLTPELRTESLRLFRKVFYEFMPGVENYVDRLTDWEESRVIILGDQLAGCYALCRQDIYLMAGTDESTEKYRNGWRKGRGVHGIALAVDPGFRGLGIGKALREYPEKSARFAYSWGGAMKSLNNIDYWLTYRRLIATTGSLHITLRDHQPLGLAACYRKQCTAYDCGPSSLQMVYAYISGSYFTDHQELISVCGCNPVTGTIGSGMEAGLRLLEIPFLRNPHRERSFSFDILDATLRGGAPFILRTLTHGAKHWSIVYGKTSTGRYMLADPWLGLHSVTTEELNDRWEPRRYDGFSIL